MDKVFDPKPIEASWYSRWQDAGAFAPKQAPASYCIVLPPPNITGTLHMGHAFQDTLMDTLIRYHRMKGNQTLWQPGCDHAGIATQMVVERQLLQAGQSRHDMGREAFVDKIWEWKEKSGNAIGQQMRRLGASADWSRERFTLDEGLSAAVQKVFIQLHEEDLIYRGKRLVNWDPVLQTAVSDLEVVSEEEAGYLWHFRYPIVDSDQHITIATTRPETLLGDVAVAVHPDDPRYQGLIGKHCQLPLCNRTIPIIADDEVLMDFGTGCVKITPGHDFNDYAMGERHGLGRINILNKDATLNDSVPEAYRGMPRFDARKQIVSDLEELSLLDKIEDYTLKIPRCDRTGEIIEPYLTDQWFVKAAPLAEPAIAAVESGEIQFVPKNWENTYFDWMRNIQDWCISRQLWWGHRIPAWYDEDGNVYVGESEAAIREKHKIAPSVALKQDDDVLDTWFSSALWPFSSLGWPNDTANVDTFYPTQVLVTGFDIIFFWVARMIMMGLKFMGTKPFSTVYVHGLIQDSSGQKMSKSKGNVLDPIDLIDGIDLESLVTKRTSGLMQPQMAKKIEKSTRKEFSDGIASFGTDALRFTFCALASTTRHIRFDLPRVEGYRNFCNKIWNAARYVRQKMPEGELSLPTQGLGLSDRWILSKLQSLITLVHTHMEDYRFDLVAKACYDFTWNDYCDWYLELSKAPLQNATEQEKAATQWTLVTVLEQLCRLMHPMMPYLTEEIWQWAGPLAGAKGEFLMLQAYPEYNSDLEDKEAESAIEHVKAAIVAVRTIRGELNISPAQALPVQLRCVTPGGKEAFAALEKDFCGLARITELTWLAPEQAPPPAATGLAGDLEIFVPMAGLIDKDKEIARIEKEITKLKKEFEKSEAKLSKPSYIEKAPEDVVEKERQKGKVLQSAIAKLETVLTQVQKI